MVREFKKSERHSLMRSYIRSFKRGAWCGFIITIGIMQLALGIAASISFLLQLTN